MKKFNNTLAGTDCGDAGLPAHSRDIAKAKPVLRVVPRAPDVESSPLASRRRTHATGPSPAKQTPNAGGLLNDVLDRPKISM
jgi:hypothetical protein